MFISAPAELVTSTGFDYKDVTGWCLNSLFSTALVLIGAGQIAKTLDEKVES